MSIRHQPARTEKSRHTWCGPYALAVLFGTSYDRALEIVEVAIRRRRIAGMWNSEMMKAIHYRNRTCAKQIDLSELEADRKVPFDGARAGIRSHGFVRKPMTLTQWYKQRPDRRGTYLVNITGHYVVVSGQRIIDNHTAQWESFAKRRRFKRSLVRHVWAVSISYDN